MKWNNKELIAHLDEFKELYEKRPILDNDGGMKSPHMFPAWFMVKKLKPKILIESGVWKGLGTWFFEKASPETKIFSIDPKPEHRIYTSPNVRYQTNDFLDTDWSSMSKEDSLVFFDDHQNCMPRLKKCLKLNFQKVIVEDNYPLSQGDCCSPKKILSNEDFIIDVAGQRTTVKKNNDDFKFFKENVSVYQEMPPIFSSPITRWGDKWNGYPTPKPLLSKSSLSKYPVFFKERLDYTWICYLELSP
jgi:hypothetical protein